MPPRQTCKSLTQSPCMLLDGETDASKPELHMSEVFIRRKDSAELCAHRHDWIMQSAAGAHLNAMPARACCDPPCDSSNATMRHALSGVTKPWVWHAHLVCSLCRACTCASTLPKCLANAESAAAAQMRSIVPRTAKRLLG